MKHLKITECYYEWVIHWYTTLETWRDELLQEGLIKTAESLSGHLKYKEKDLENARAYRPAVDMSNS